MFQRGFLLAEFVVGVGLAGILSSIIVSAVFQLNKASDIGEAKLQAVTEVQRGTIWLARDIRQASSSDLGDGGPAVTTATFLWTDPAGQGGEPHICTYALSGTNLQRTLDGVPSVVARSVSGLLFTRTASLVSISFTVTPDADPDFAEDVSMSVAMRAS
jgi:type II secretory pathway component PulJ